MCIQYFKTAAFPSLHPCFPTIYGYHNYLIIGLWLFGFVVKEEGLALHVKAWFPHRELEFSVFSCYSIPD